MNGEVTQDRQECLFCLEVHVASTQIKVFNNGPIRFEGDFEMVDPNGRPFGLSGCASIALCRCGHSVNKPFCDGAHRTCGFTDSVQARELPPAQPKT